MSTLKLLSEDYRQDVFDALNIWNSLLKDHADIEYAYAKGSAIKLWESDIDYVPIISDVDLHIYSRTSYVFSDVDAWQIPLLYERELSRFSYKHVPRINVKEMNDLKHKIPDMVLSDPKFHKTVLGSPPLGYGQNQNDVNIREIDRKNLLEMKTFYPGIPEMVIDRTGIEFWTILRRMTWRVSPTPVRLLSQILTNTSELWEKNRTGITQLLNDNGFEQIAELYSSFYITGWDLYTSGLKDSKLYVSMIKTAYLLLKETILEVEKL